MNNKQTADRMCIPIEKVREEAGFADYRFSAAVSEPHPRNRHGTVIVGQVHGILRIDKASGAIALLEPMPGDNDRTRFLNASRKIKRHWEAGEFPDKTIFACG